jgi:hypothetical protein
MPFPLWDTFAAVSRATSWRRRERVVAATGTRSQRVVGRGRERVIEGGVLPNLQVAYGRRTWRRRERAIEGGPGGVAMTGEAAAGGDNDWRR